MSANAVTGWWVAFCIAMDVPASHLSGWTIVVVAVSLAGGFVFGAAWQRAGRRAHAAAAAGVRDGEQP